MILIAAIICRVASCYFAKRASNNHALIEGIEQSYIESFENYKFCVRPMFAVNYIMAVRLWRREIVELNRQCNSVLEKNNYASTDIRSSVRDLIHSINCLQSDLGGEIEYREEIAKGIMEIDKAYEEFSKIAEENDHFVERIVYSDEYK